MIFSMIRSNFVKVVPSPENFVARTSAHLPSKIIDIMMTTVTKKMMRMMRMMIGMMLRMLRMLRMIRMTATFPERSHTSLQTQIFAWSDLKVGFLIIPLTIMTIISRQPQWKIFLIILDVKNNHSYQITKGSKFWMLPFVFIYIWQLTCYRNVSQFVGDPNQTSTYMQKFVFLLLLSYLDVSESIEPSVRYQHWTLSQ